MKTHGVLRLLLVDDNETFLDVLRAYFEAIHAVVIVGVARSGEHALALTELRAPDLVIIDLAMPGIGGLQATRALKALPNPPKVAVLTLHGEENFRQAALDAGADFFVPKDRLHEEFSGVLAKILQP